MKDLYIDQANSVAIINPQIIKIEKLEFRWRVTINNLMEFTVESADQLPDWIIQNPLNRQVGWTRTITITETWPEGRNAIDEVWEAYTSQRVWLTPGRLDEDRFENRLGVITCKACRTVIEKDVFVHACEIKQQNVKID